MKTISETYTKTTHGVRINVFSQFSPEHSKTDAGIFVYIYTITISNETPESVQLLSRHWEISDGLGRTENIIGEGVIGQKPIISPQDSFTYSSSCPLQTPSGSMKGRYQMRNSSQELFDVEIPEFFLKDSRLMN